MALQPAAGARDLNPRQVEGNRRIRQQLASLYRLWGYQEVDPPTVERVDTLAAGGGIPSQELVRLVSDDPLGLRPELTASIARAACTRMADRPMPLRLWADGNSFGCSLGEAGRQRIHQQITSGVELLGDPTLSADVELMRLLIAAVGRLGLRAEHKPSLLIGHHGVLQALIQDLPLPVREQAQAALTAYDPLALAALDVADSERRRLLQLLQLRGEPDLVLAELRRLLGALPLLDDLNRMLALVAPAAAQQGVVLQLDPSFQPHFNLYDGLVLKLVCQGSDVPVSIASGGRYDALVGRFSTPASLRSMAPAGVGFGFDVENLRELLQVSDQGQATLLVAYQRPEQLTDALAALEQLHAAEQPAELLGQAVNGRGEAEALATQRGCSGVHWLGT